MVLLCRGVFELMQLRELGELLSRSAGGPQVQVVAFLSILTLSGSGRTIPRIARLCHESAAMSINPPVLGMLEALASPLEAFRVTWPASTVHGRNEVFLAYRPGMKVDMKRPNEGTTTLHCAM
jgi:hypothetical protein